MPSRLKKGRKRPLAEDDGTPSSLYYLDCKIVLISELPPTIAMPTWPRNANLEDGLRSQSTE